MPSDRQLRNEDAATTLEDRQASLASAELRAQLAAATAVITAARRAGKKGAELAELIGRTLRAVLALGTQESIRTVLLRAAVLGYRLGRRQVLGGTQPADRLPNEVILMSEIASVIGLSWARTEKALEDAIAAAGQLPLESDEDLAVVFARARRAVTGVETDAGWITHRAVAAGKHVAAAEDGWSLVWVAERNACLNCLAYAGRVIAPYGTFPEGLTYGDKPLKPFGPLFGPPLHPNCRCQLDRTNLAPGDLDVALAREAARSVARGLTDHASDAARFRAVDRLISGTTGLPDQNLIRLPRSVLDRARRNLAAGQFKYRPGSPEARAAITERTRERARR